MTNLLNVFLVLFAVFASNAYAARMSVIAPTELAIKFNDDIEFSTAHFGNVPFGAHLVGNLKLSNPIEACEPLEHFAKKSEWSEQTNIVAVVKRGGCRIPIKSRHAQQAGAKILLIVDDRDDPLSEWFGHEHGDDDINIPTLMINKKAGEEIIKYLQQGQLGQDSSDPIVIINFPTEQKSWRVRLDFWYSAADVFGSSYRFLRHIREVARANNLRVRPHYVTWTSGNAKRQGFTIAEPDCLSGGRYCAPDPDDAGPLTGADVVYEDLRQACIATTNNELWWEYTKEYSRQCLRATDLRACGNKALQEKATPTEFVSVVDCMISSWKVPTGKSVNEGLDDNNVLANEKELQSEYQINSFPALFINHKPYTGNLNNIFDILKESCNNMSEMSDQCKAILGIRDFTQQPVNHTKRVILVMIVMSLVSFCIFYFCRRMIKRESKDMSMQVGGMVTRYFALKETTTGARDDENDG